MYISDKGFWNKKSEGSILQIIHVYHICIQTLYFFVCLYKFIDWYWQKRETTRDDWETEKVLTLLADACVY